MDVRTRRTRIHTAVVSLAAIGAAGLSVGLATPASAKVNQAEHGCRGTEVVADEFAHAPAFPIVHELVPAAIGGCLE
jgi:hypothetical protein